MVTVDALYRTLEEMRGIYPFKDEETAFELEINPYLSTSSMVTIQTRDEGTDIHIQLTKDASKKAGGVE